MMASRVFALASLFVFAGCGANNSTNLLSSTGVDSVANVSQTVVGQAGSDASASESSASIATLDVSGDVSGRAQASSACSYSSARSACASSGDTIAWNGCTVSDGGSVSLTLTGGWTETFSGTSGGGMTAASSCQVPIITTEQVVRASPGGSTITINSSNAILNGATLVTDTNAATAYDGTAVAGGGSTISNSGGTRTVTWNGIHRTLSLSGGTKLLDHLIKTTTPLTITGTKQSGGTRTITSGVSVLYHQLAQYTATSTFSNVAYSAALCCYPTSGTLTTQFAGKVTGSTTMTFTSTCGQATFVDNTNSTTNSSGTITLNQCAN